jgi:flagellar hook-associated protein 2
MAESTLQVSGLSSGFDWRNMIDQLIAVEHRRVDIVEDKKSDYEAQLSEWQSFNTKLQALNTVVEDLKDPESFNLFTTSMSSNNINYLGSDLLSVSTDTDAARGNYSIMVTNMATAQKVSSNPFTSQTTALGSSYAGDILINGKVITIDADDSLAYLTSSINNANSGTDPIGITASIVKYAANDYRLVLTSDETGAEGINLLNGGTADLLQQFGWKDSQTSVVKNSITNGVQSDRFQAPNVVVKSLLGLSSGEASSGSLTIGGTAVSIDLSSMSLNDIKDAVNNASITGVTASVISEDADNTTYYRLQIDGTQAIVDENNILNTLGILDHTSVDVSGKVSENTLTTDGAYLIPTTLLEDIDGYNTFTAGGNPTGDYITLTGTDTTGTGIGTVNFDISSTTTVQDLLDQIESSYGNVVAYVTSDGKIQVDDLSGGSSLDVSLAATIQDTSSQLNFGTFGTEATRKREVISGQDATVEIDGVSVTSSTNVIDDVISGVTLNLVAESDSTTLSLNIDYNREKIQSNIQTFVDKYNDVMGYINSQFSFDAEAEETGGILFGDGTLRSVKSDLTALISESIWGLDNDFSSLGLVGIENRLNNENQLELRIDEATLNGYLQTNLKDIVSLFTGQGTPSNSTVTYVGHSRSTEAGEYAVHIDRAATRAEASGSVDLSGGSADETLSITQGNSTAEITITNGMSLNDTINEINTELDTTYTQTLVGDEQLYADSGQSSAITSDTTWNGIYSSLGDQLSFANDDTLSFSGTNRSGNEVSGTYQISDVTSDTVQGLLSAMEDLFSSKVTASIDTSGRIVIHDTFEGYSQLAISSISHAGEGEFFGATDVTAGAGDGSQEGRYAMDITAMDDGSNHLLLRSEAYGTSSSFTLSQDTSDNNYNHIISSTTENTTVATSGSVSIAGATTWSDVYGADVVNNDTITISGKARDGVADISGTYTVTDITTDTIDGLLSAIESAFSAQGTTVDAVIQDGMIFVEDTTAGSSSISLTLTANNEGGGSLGMGTIDQTTQRDLDLGLINGTHTGLDVAGTIDGESATGSGRVLTGDDDNTNTDGLSISYRGSSDDIDAGTIKMTLGVGERFDRVLFNIADTIDGYVAFKQNSLQDKITSIGEQVEQMEGRLDKKMDRLINQYVAMELTLSRLQNQSDWLAGQIGALFSGWR